MNILRKIKKYLFKKTVVERINNVLILYKNEIENDHNYIEDKGFLEGLSYIKEDFNFSWINISFRKLKIDEIREVDFILVYDEINGEVDNYIRSLKEIKVPKGLLIKGFKGNDKTLFKYDVIWFQSFDFANNNLSKHYNKFHAFGINIKGINKPKISFIENEFDLLKARYFDEHSVFIDKNKGYLKEFLKSPIWDEKYYGIQLREGINSLLINNTIATKLIKPSFKLMVGRNSFFNRNLLITGDEYVKIGSYCSFGRDISIYTSNHDVNYASTQGYIYRKNFNNKHPGELKEKPSLSRTKGPVIIENDVWIGDGVKIMSGVKIGNGACIAAGSIITKDVRDYEIVGGIPAKHLKMRFDNDNIISFLLDLKWWDWSDKKISLNKEFFYKNLGQINSINEININEL